MPTRRNYEQKQDFTPTEILIVQLSLQRKVKVGCTLAFPDVPLDETTIAEIKAYTKKRCMLVVTDIGGPDWRNGYPFEAVLGAHFAAMACANA